jgi:hypothetical protein
VKFLSLKTLLSLFALFLIAGCSLAPKSTLVEGTQREQVLASGEPIADHLFKGMNDGDYQAFSRDFNVEMKKALDEKAFNQMAQSFSQKIGQYQSRQVVKVEAIENLYVITYQAKFEKEDPVSIRLTLRPQTEAVPMQVAGLWFDSPKLRSQ